jgi:hypothetical protein
MKMKLKKGSDYDARNTIANRMHSDIMETLSNDCWSRREKCYVRETQHDWIIEYTIKKKVTKPKGDD